MKKIAILLSLGLLFAVSCERNNGSDITHCDKNVIIDGIEYQNATDDNVSIVDVKIKGNCLKIKFGASGCDGSTWNERLNATLCRGAGNPYWLLMFSLENNEDCSAWITKETSFNIKDLKLQEKNNVRLHFGNTGQWILYKY